MANILIIEDDAPIRLLTCEFLRRAGHTIREACNGREGIELATRETFDLVLTDIIMPEKEGIEVIMDLRRKQPGLRIIAMSGGGRISANDCLSLAQKLGAKATLNKPFGGTELLATVAAVLGMQESTSPSTGAA
ncbi:MAG: response regulator [Pedosphaera sp. Tous-C6FEB]|nr:MAG: response regulator [Pedosphaera sp. Tous-C6FEB]